MSDFSYEIRPRPLEILIFSCVKSKYFWPRFLLSVSYRKEFTFLNPIGRKVIRCNPLVIGFFFGKKSFGFVLCGSVGLSGVTFPGLVRD